MPQQLSEIKAMIKQLLSVKEIIRTYSYLKPFLTKQKWIYSVLMILLLVDIFLTISFAWFYGTITDSALHGNLQEIKKLIPVGIGLLALGISSTFIGVLYESKASQGIKQLLKNHLYHHISCMPANLVSEHRTGELLSYFTNDLHSVDGLTGSSLLSLVRLPLIYISVFIFLAQINITLSLITVVIAPVALISGLVLGLLLRNNGRKIHDLVANINSFQNEAFLGRSVIRSFTLEQMFFKTYKSKNRQLFNLEIQNAKFQGFFFSGGQLISTSTFLITLCLGAFYVLSNVMTVGALIMFINLVNYLVYPLTGLASQWVGFQRAVAAIERVLKVLDEPTETDILSTYREPKKIIRSIEFKNITFTYDGKNNIFENFYLKIPAGETIALVGPSGAGKTSFINLLQRFFQPRKGEIFLDGSPCSTMDVSELRSTISHVPQETFLFSGTIRKNLMLSKPNLSEVEMINAAKNAQIHDFIQSLPHGYDSEIGEGGVKLSGGQKQRIAITRALLKDAPILILDEATSALDNNTELNVKNALNSLIKEKTTIIIAHRISTIQNADRIIVMDEGRIVQDGKHEDLIRIDGLYSRLYHNSNNETEPYLELTMK